MSILTKSAFDMNVFKRNKVFWLEHRYNKHKGAASSRPIGPYRVQAIQKEASLLFIILHCHLGEEIGKEELKFWQLPQAKVCRKYVGEER